MARFFASRFLRLILLSFLTVLICAAPALADLVTWNLSGVTLADVGSVTGSIVYDTVSQGISCDLTVDVAPGSWSSLIPTPTNPFVFTRANSVCSINGTTVGFASPPTQPPADYVAYTLIIMGQGGSLAGPDVIPLTGVSYAVDAMLWGEVSSGTWEWTLNGGAYWYWSGGELSQVPTPTAALLLGSGLIPLAWFRLRNRWRK